VPLLVVSAYGVNNKNGQNGQCVRSIDGSDVLDFGSIANFIEGNFSGGWIPANEGQLHFADARAVDRHNNLGMTEDLLNFFDLTRSACTFTPIYAPPGYDASSFIKDNSQPVVPDDD
jgi:hypothetical protein